MRHILGNKVLQYDVDDRGVIVDEREDVSVEVYAETLMIGRNLQAQNIPLQTRASI